MAQRLSIIIPVLNETAHIGDTLRSLEELQSRGHEVIVVDGGSHDETIPIAHSFADQVINSFPGRARQMNTGASIARGDVLLFLHADSILPLEADHLILAGMEGRQPWGRFDVRLSGTHFMFRVIESMMNFRSCFTGVATGDQGLFVERKLFNELGGFPEIPLMEDIAFSKQLRRQAKPICIKQRLETSSRRWESRGILRTILLMWKLRLLYWLGSDPAVLARLYR